MSRLVSSLGSAGGAGSVIFGSVGQDRQLVHHIHGVFSSFDQNIRSVNNIEQMSEKVNRQSNVFYLPC